VIDDADPTGQPAGKRSFRWDAAGAPRIAEHALLVIDPAPMVIRNGKGCRAFRRSGDGLCAAPAAGIPPH